MQLATAGLVTLQPRRGAFVASLSLKDIVERFEVMAALEAACGALAARRITDEERRGLLAAPEARAPRGGGGGPGGHYYPETGLPQGIFPAGPNTLPAPATRPPPHPP